MIIFGEIQEQEKPISPDLENIELVGLIRLMPIAGG